LNSYSNKEAAVFFEEALQINDKLKKSDTPDYIGTERKLGQAFYNMGQLSKADQHLRKALRQMAIDIPSDPKRQTAKAVQKLKLATWTFSRERTPNASELPHRKREAVLALALLARVNYYASCRSVATFCALLAVRIVAEVGGEWQWTEIFATNVYISGINGDHMYVL
jgi:tetratricopeptide (TPR) repeat protein